MPAIRVHAARLHGFRKFQRCKSGAMHLEAAGIAFIDDDSTGGIGVTLRAGVKLPPVDTKKW